jgi:hypothetical protein
MSETKVRHDLPTLLRMDLPVLERQRGNGKRVQRHY